MFPKTPIIFLILIFFCVGLHAEDLGAVGPTYEISERDFIEVIKDKLRAMEKTGQLAKIQDDYKKGVMNSVERPKPVPGIHPTETARTFYIDPTRTIEKSVVDEHGRILYPAGMRINPFDYDRMTKKLLFFDASDEKQIDFAKRFIEQSPMMVKPILVGGEPLKLMRKWKREVFFDQGGALSKRFALKQTPAVVGQEGKRLRIDEIRL